MLKGFHAYVKLKKYQTYYQFFGLKTRKFWPHGNRSNVYAWGWCAMFSNSTNLQKSHRIPQLLYNRYYYLKPSSHQKKIESESFFDFLSRVE